MSLLLSAFRSLRFTSSRINTNNEIAFQNRHSRTIVKSCSIATATSPTSLSNANSRTNLADGRRCYHSQGHQCDCTSSSSSSSSLLLSPTLRSSSSPVTHSIFRSARLQSDIGCISLSSESSILPISTPFPSPFLPVSSPYPFPNPLPTSDPSSFPLEIHCGGTPKKRQSHQRGNRRRAGNQRIKWAPRIFTLYQRCPTCGYPMRRWHACYKCALAKIANMNAEKREAEKRVKVEQKDLKRKAWQEREQNKI